MACFASHACHLSSVKANIDTVATMKKIELNFVTSSIGRILSIFSRFLECIYQRKILQRTQFIIISNIQYFVKLESASSLSRKRDQRNPFSLYLSRFECKNSSILVSYRLQNPSIYLKSDDHYSPTHGCFISSFETKAFYYRKEKGQLTRYILPPFFFIHRLPFR